MEENLNCIGNCRLCSVLGECPPDHLHCEDCRAEIEPGEGITIEVEAIISGHPGTKMITVCPVCFADHYQGDETIEFE
ncbi:hypothetical protein [Bacteroides fragilis]|uniref:hypothetical protein n=1 Tax=Bacteroides fragilis TaxID=817 RepID=UPI003DA63543